MAVIHQMLPRSWALTNLTESAGKEEPATQPPPPQADRGDRWGHVSKAQGLALRWGSFDAIRQMSPQIVAGWRGENLHWP